MQIKRDYSRTFFSGPRRPRRNYTRVLFIFGLLVGGLLIVVMTNYEQLQVSALDMIGLAPTATPLPSDLATLGMELVMQGDLEAAADFFDRALSQRPNNIEYMHAYGQVLIEMNSPFGAIVLGDRMIELAPLDPRGFALKARALLSDDQATSAIATALTGLDVDNTYAPLMGILARAYTDTGRYQDGMEMGLRAVEADPSDVDARRAYAYALSWMGLNDEATDQLEMALALDPNRLPTYFELALQYLARNRDDEAIDLYDRILAIQPNNARAQLRLCTTYRKVGQFERAAGYCEDAISNDPALIGAYYHLGILKYNAFDFEGAADAFAECVATDPENLECTYRLGLSYYYLDDCETGWDLLETARLMAQGRSNTETALEHIREGMAAIMQKCPTYRSVSVPGFPIPDPDEAEDEDAAEVTAEPDAGAGG